MKDKPYPLRIETEMKQQIETVAFNTGLTQSVIMRMAIQTGLQCIDWKALARPPLKSGTVRYPQPRPGAWEMNDSPATDTARRGKAVRIGTP